MGEVPAGVPASILRTVSRASCRESPGARSRSTLGSCGGLSSTLITPLKKKSQNTLHINSCRWAPKGDKNRETGLILGREGSKTPIFCHRVATDSVTPAPYPDLQSTPECEIRARGGVHVDRSRRPHQALRRTPGGQRRVAGGGGWRAVRAPGLFGERQEHAATHDRRPLRRRRRPGAAPWPRRHRPAAGQAGG